MARTVAELPKGARITDYISLGVLTKTFPLDRVNAAVAAAGVPTESACARLNTPWNGRPAPNRFIGW